LHTSFFRIYFQESLCKELEDFVFIAWECLNIFKEAFPSKIETFQENMDSYCGLELEAYKKEIFRRQITYINSRGKSIEPMNSFEIEDLFYLLEQSLLEGDMQALKICLTVLNSPLCPPLIFLHLSESQSMVLESICQQENFFKDNMILNNEFDEESYYENKKLALNVLNKLLKMKNYKILEHNDWKSNQNNTSSEEIFEKFKLEEPQSLPSQLFQLRESLDLERITFLLNDLLQKNPEVLIKNRFLNTLINIIERYSKGELGIDSSYLTKYCIFQNKILKYFFQNLDNEQILNELIKADCVNSLAQIIQEGILNIVQNTINFDENEIIEKEYFLKYSMGIMEKFASFYQCKDNIKDALNYVKEIVGSYLGESETQQFMKDLENLGQNLSNFYKRVVILSKNIILTEERYKEENNKCPKDLGSKHFLLKKTRDFLNREMKSTY